MSPLVKTSFFPAWKLNYLQAQVSMLICSVEQKVLQKNQEYPSSLSHTLSFFHLSASTFYLMQSNPSERQKWFSLEYFSELRGEAILDRDDLTVSRKGLNSISHVESISGFPPICKRNLIKGLLGEAPYKIALL